MAIPVAGTVVPLPTGRVMVPGANPGVYRAPIDLIFGYPDELTAKLGALLLTVSGSSRFKGIYGKRGILLRFVKR